MLAALILALGSLAGAQDSTRPAAPAADGDLDADASLASPFDRVVEIVLSAEDPALAGHGPGRWIDYVAGFSGTLHVWTSVKGNFDTFLRVEGARELVAEDDHSGGAPTPYLAIPVEPEMSLAIAVAASKSGDSGVVDVHLVAAPETDASREEAERAQQEVVEIQGLRKAGDSVAAGSRVVALIERLSMAENAANSDLVTGQLWNAAAEANALGLGDASQRALRRIADHRSRTLPPDHLNLQRARLNLGIALRAGGDDAAARRLFEGVLEVCTRTLHDDAPATQLARLHLASTIKAQGDLAGARLLEEQVLASRSKILPNEDPDIQVARLQLAGTLKALGDLAAARALEEQILAVRSRNSLPEDPGLQRARANLAETLMHLGDHETARVLFEQVFQVFSRQRPIDDPDLQAARVNLAAALKSCGELARARALEEQALEVYTQRPSCPPRLLHTARTNLAATLSELGDFAAARVLQEQVLEALSLTLPADHPDLQVCRTNLAFTLAHERANSTQADRRHAEVFAALATEFTRSLAASARAALLTGSSREAEERCANLSADLGRALSFAEGLGVFERSGELERLAFLASEASRGASLASGRLARSAAAHPRYAELREQIRSASAELARSVEAGPSALEFDGARSRRDAAERELVGMATDVLAAPGAVELDLEALSAELTEDDAIVAYRRYWRFRVASDRRHETTESLCAFVARSRGRLQRIELGAIDPIQTAVRAWRIAVGIAPDARGVSVASDGQTPLRASGAAGELRRSVFDPLLPALDGARRLVFVPDDVLHLVPLDALPAPDAARANGEPQALLGDHWRIETRAASTELLIEPEPLGESIALLAIGGVDYGADTSNGATHGPSLGEGAAILRDSPWSQGFAELPSTIAEVNGIARHFHDAFGSGASVELLTGNRPTRAILYDLARRARFLHVATHGWFAAESTRSMLEPASVDPTTSPELVMDAEARVQGMAPMLLCGLALAGANRSGAELGRSAGLLTAEEIATLDFRNCELAVLSACDTNVGERRAGQGVASLQRALHMAGARTVITSLWKVPDEATAVLMRDFYRRIWIEKEPKHEALWAAKTALRDAVDERGVAKYTTRDWAAWVLTGVPE